MNLYEKPSYSSHHTHITTEYKHSNTMKKRNNNIYQKFEIEKKAKNRAYAFILSHDLYDQFVVFCRTHPVVLSPIEMVEQSFAQHCNPAKIH